YFFNVMPETVERISVLDRTKEPGALGEPLYQDVVAVYGEKDKDNMPLIVGGRYGLGSKDTTPAQIKAVFDNLKMNEPKNHFTIGIVDDVTFTSLPVTEAINTVPEGTISCKFWGLGSDGTVGANQNAIKIIGDETDMYAQGYFSYDSKKSGRLTVSHLRFGHKPITSTYLIDSADFVACHNQAYVNQYDMIGDLKDGGTFLLNCLWTPEELDYRLPAHLKREIKERNIKFYTINAIDIAGEIGLGGRINMIMQTAFFKLADIIPIDEAVEYIKEAIVNTYGRLGENVVKMNHEAVDRGLDSLVKIDVPESWADSEDEKEEKRDLPDFIRDIVEPMIRQEGDELPVSSFVGAEDGTFLPGTASFEKRGIAVTVPEWQIDNCIQCNQCSYVCPHAAIRPFLLNEEERENAPEGFESKKAIGRGMQDYTYRIQVTPLDCTGCGNCADICPSREKALIMKPFGEQRDAQVANWDYAMTITKKEVPMAKTTLKGSQFEQPLLEFSGACAGCGETPYAKLITQLFGSRMVIANATGCSSIWGASAPSTPYTTDADGRGPAWANSLFEDNAEFGFGMYLAAKQIRGKIADNAKALLDEDISEELKAALENWLENKDDGEASREASDKLIPLLDGDALKNPLVKEIYERKDHLTKRSQWILGGDGWAYDIGYGGLDHVLASGEDVNVLVFDTEVYSNTGGQSSKATPAAAVAKFAASGKRIEKKDLGLMAMSYGYVYVAQVAMGANMNQVIRAITEAEKYDGPSLIIAYSPCINHGIRRGMGKAQDQMKLAVESGYWHLYRYNPELKDEGKNPFILDSKEPTASFRDFLMGESRYTSLVRTFPEVADELFEKAERDAKERYAEYKRLAEQS
ncbi:MAG: pyruvate:ferredoxin (flavodoxin) oxidoreductase, partial [Clostridiales bacterium]|nr:pyruvate:ferredoxin (flavodoxin) oxidoreductase [Clostridiales bacterium]